MEKNIENEKFNSSIAIQVLPTVENREKLLEVVDKVIKFIESKGLNTQVGAFETTIEGEYDELMEIVKECQKIAIKSGASSVMSYVKINYNPNEGVLTIDEKVNKYNK